MSLEATYQVPTIYNIIKARAPIQHAPLRVTVPGSKSITNRSLLLATLANGSSTLYGALFSDDSRHFLKCIQDLGIETTVNEELQEITVKGLGGTIPLTEASLYVGSAGTAARFLTAYLGLQNGIYHMDASPQMRKRPMAALLNSLKELGCEVLYEGDAAVGHFPFTLHGHGFCKDNITINIDNSSQFLSALLIASGLAGTDFTTSITGTHGMSYIEMTLKMMEQFGVKAAQISSDSFCTKGGQAYQALDYQVEPDVSAACYFYAMSPLLGISVLVNHVHFDSLQGDVAFIKILEQMGCTATDTPDGILVEPPLAGGFQGVTVDMSACSDQAITLAAIAPFAETTTTISGIGHIRFQESDRIAAIVTELTKMGIRCEETETSLTIYPGTPLPSAVDTYDDHRMAMGFALIGLRCKGIVIRNPMCCQKTFETYFSILDTIAASYLADTQ